MCPSERFSNNVFADFTSTCLDHHNSLASTSHNQVKIVVRHFFKRQKCCRFAIFEADTDTGNWALKGCTGQHKCCAHCNHRNSIRTETRIEAQDARNALCFVAVALWPERPDRTVDNTADQNSLFARTAFTLDEAAAADFASSIHFLFVVDTQREIVKTFHWLGGDHSGTQYCRIAVAHQHAAAVRNPTRLTSRLSGRPQNSVSTFIISLPNGLI